MRALGAIGALLVFGCLPSPAPAASLDGSAPMLCALTSVVECARRGDCERTSAEDAGIPSFIRVNVPQKILSSLDGGRTSPITNVQRNNGRLMLQGMQNERVWGAVIDEQTGQMSATTGEADGAFVIVGNCIAP